MKPLFLVGYMGCGKSSIGRKLSRRMGLPFVDTDAVIEEQEGATVADLFHYEGEEQFRQIERAVLERVIAQGEPAIVSTGGGLPVWQDNMGRMNAAGVTIYLKRSVEQIISRLSPYGRQKRPRLRGLSDEELTVFMTHDLAVREPFYSQAILAVDCSQYSDERLLEELVKLYEELG